MNLTEAIKEISDKYAESHLHLSVKELAGHDIDGGLNFEQTNRYIEIRKGKWLIRTVREKTVQPEWGPTITSTIDSRENEYTDEQFKSFLTGDEISIVELKSVLSVIASELNQRF